MTNAEALAEVYVALGGSAGDVAGKSNAEIIAAIATKTALVAGATLPAASGNGKVLTVVSSKWQAANVPTELPSVTQANAGQVLTVNAEGKWAAANLPASNT